MVCYLRDTYVNASMVAAIEPAEDGSCIIHFAGYGQLKLPDVHVDTAIAEVQREMENNSLANAVGNVEMKLHNITVHLSELRRATEAWTNYSNGTIKLEVVSP